MHNLAAITPLGGANAREDRIGGITIAENPGRAMASLTTRLGRDADVAKAAKKLFGFALPEPGRMESKGDWAAFWTGPGQWMVTAPFEGHEDIAPIVKAGLGDAASITEQTDGWAQFDVGGSGVVDMLERLCPVPSRRMKAGDATRTSIEHLGCFVLCRTTGEAFTVICPRSSAASMHHALSIAARSIV
ncbi:sarcosine oxidase, gamma subunit [Defluviimonas sp. WL0050]|uniref:Sarcosine oxidase, gamma subunit n=1 Tax=Albidovulum litorale TaxID=2984134 RepID=A0ABT2ZNJ0_9RHOB|nr:sarcosine oxidase, gamma subunit [Defluviimonas sp. WL0050]MCV2872311.1 sarcosine oxidase, gamma subunit [Defluviimonas sp. WL0050]